MEEEEIERRLQAHERSLREKVKTVAKEYGYRRSSRSYSGPHPDTQGYGTYRYTDRENGVQVTFTEGRTHIEYRVRVDTENRWKSVFTAGYGPHLFFCYEPAPGGWEAVLDTLYADVQADGELSDE